MAGDFKSYRDHSRTNWGLDGGAIPTNEQLNTGALLRIADATELMAKRHQELINQRDQFERSTNYWRDRAGSLEKSNRSLRGQITKLRNRIQRLDGIQAVEKAKEFS